MFSRSTSAFLWIKYCVGVVGKSIIMYLIEECLRLEKASSANIKEVRDCFLKIFRNSQHDFLNKKAVVCLKTKKGGHCLLKILRNSQNDCLE